MTTHTKQRQKTDQICQTKSICTIVIKVFKNVKAIPKCVATTYHNTDGIDINFCVQTVSRSFSMYKLGFSYSSIMPGWIRDTFFNCKLERHRLAVHQYCENDLVRMGQMKDARLVEFLELTLLYSVIPCIGPLHISLNGRETVFKCFIGFFEIIHNQLFPRSKLSKSPRPCP